MADEKKRPAELDDKDRRADMGKLYFKNPLPGLAEFGLPLDWSYLGQVARFEIQKRKWFVVDEKVHFTFCTTTWIFTLRDDHGNTATLNTQSEDAAQDMRVMMVARTPILLEDQ